MTSHGEVRDILRWGITNKLQCLRRNMECLSGSAFLVATCCMYPGSEMPFNVESFLPVHGCPWDLLLQIEAQNGLKQHQIDAIFLEDFQSKLSNVNDTDKLHLKIIGSVKDTVSPGDLAPSSVPLDSLTQSLLDAKLVDTTGIIKLPPRQPMKNMLDLLQHEEDDILYFTI